MFLIYAPRLKSSVNTDQFMNIAPAQDLSALLEEYMGYHQPKILVKARESCLVRRRHKPRASLSGGFDLNPQRHYNNSYLSTPHHFHAF